MIKTYVIENEQNQVVQYFHTLHDAKQYCVKNFDKPYEILAIKGDYFGERFNQYRLKYNSSKLVFNKVWSK